MDDEHNDNPLLDNVSNEADHSSLVIEFDPSAAENSYEVVLQPHPEASQTPLYVHRELILTEREPFVAPVPGSMPERPLRIQRLGRVVHYEPTDGVAFRHYPATHAPTHRWNVLEATLFWLFFYPCHTTIGYVTGGKWLQVKHFNVLFSSLFE